MQRNQHSTEFKEQALSKARLRSLDAEYIDSFIIRSRDLLSAISFIAASTAATSVSLEPRPAASPSLTHDGAAVPVKGPTNSRVTQAFINLALNSPALGVREV